MVPSLDSRLPAFVREHYECHEWKHASAILTQDFPAEWRDVMDVLTAFRLRRSWITTPGGRKSQVSDCFRNGIALEIEWNNKDPFYDRDLNNFRLLFDLRTVSVGIIVTRSDELQALFQRLGRGPSYGASTTHMGKLLPRIAGGGGAGCPLLVFGIRASLFVEDES